MKNRKPLLQTWENRAICWLERVTGKRISRNACTTLLQFVKFGIVGASNFVVNYSVYALALLVFREFQLFASADYYIAQIAAFVLSVLWSFYWNNRFVFNGTYREAADILKALLKTYISYAFTGLILSEILLHFWVQVLEISEWIAPIINIAICIPINFILNKLWTFQNK